MLPLGLLCPGETGEIIEIRIQQNVCRDACGCKETPGKCDVRIEDLGLRVGKQVEMLTSGSGPVLLKVDESRIAVARGLAMKIMVRKPG
jgi:ferrous iron transport protein A